MNTRVLYFQRTYIEPSRLWLLLRRRECADPEAKEAQGCSNAARNVVRYELREESSDTCILKGSKVR
jgi:hypothetical protein